MKKTAIIGPIHTEIIEYFSSLPKGNEEMIPLRTSQVIGGSGYLTAHFFQEVGFPYELLAPIGSGVYADFVFEQAKQKNIKVYPSLEIAGCAYRMIDDEGNENVIRVPGGEYLFPHDMISDLTLEDYQQSIVFGDMLLSEEPIEVLSFLSHLQLPFVFVPNECWDEIDEEIQETIIEMNPMFILSDTEAYYMMNEDSEELLECAKDLNYFIKAPVLILKQNDGCIYYDGIDSYFAPEKERIHMSAWVAIFMLARIAGIDVKNAMMLANEYAVSYTYEDEDANYYTRLKNDLARRILTPQ